MGVTVRIEIDPDGKDEVIIRCRRLDDNVLYLQRLLEGGNMNNGEIALKLSGNEYFVPYKAILFFETSGEKVVAHTSGNMLYSEKNLSELTTVLPGCFMRVSKSTIINLSAVSSVTKGFSGNAEAGFNGSTKTTYVSRMYYKAFRERIEEMRFKYERK